MLAGCRLQGYCIILKIPVSDLLTSKGRKIHELAVL